MSAVERSGSEEGDGRQRRRSIVAGILLLVLLTACTHRGRTDAIVTISNPTVIGFAVEASHDDFEQMNDAAVAQDDFVTSWASFVAWAQVAGITTDTSAPHLTLLVNGKRVRVREQGFGYLLVDPSGRRKKIEGVQTDADLIHSVCIFFLAPPVQDACANRR